jgi:hypothetical protein
VPSGESRRIRAMDQDPILSATKLFIAAGQQVWPPPQPAIDVAAIVPHLPAGGDWHETIRQREAERRAESVRVTQYHARMAKEREDREIAEAKAARGRSNVVSP